MALVGLNPLTGLLPPGEHVATMEEVADLFVYNLRRRQIFSGPESVVNELWSFGVRLILLDGSFVTAKLRPGDIDVVFEPTQGYSLAWGLLHIQRRDQLKQLRMVDLWPTFTAGTQDPTTGLPVPILEFFKRDRNSGNEKGIVKLDLGGYR